MSLSVPDQDAPEEEWNRFFESHGEPKLRMLLANDGWPQSIKLPTVQWLAWKDEEAEARRDASQSEQIDIARSAKDAAWAAATAADRAATAAEAANKRATVALIAAVISIVVTIIGLILVHLDSLRSAH